MTGTPHGTNHTGVRACEVEQALVPRIPLVGSARFLDLLDSGLDRRQALPGKIDEPASSGHLRRLREHRSVGEGRHRRRPALRRDLHCLGRRRRRVHPHPGRCRDRGAGWDALRSHHLQRDHRRHPVPGLPGGGRPAGRRHVLGADGPRSPGTGSISSTAAYRRISARPAWRWSSYASRWPPPANESIARYLRYDIHLDKESLFNTPPTAPARRSTTPRASDVRSSSFRDSTTGWSRRIRPS